MPTRRDFAGREESFNVLRRFTFASNETQKGGPPPIEGIDGGPSARVTISPVHDGHVGRGTDGDRGGCRCRGGRESEDGAGHE
jgi:hypothetical protein